MSSVASPVLSRWPSWPRTSLIGPVVGDEPQNATVRPTTATTVAAEAMTMIRRHFEGIGGLNAARRAVEPGSDLTGTTVGSFQRGCAGTTVGSPHSGGGVATVAGALSTDQSACSAGIGPD